MGAWLNYQIGNLHSTDLQQPYTIIWPSLAMLGCTVLRTIIGFVLVFLTRLAGKVIAYNVLCKIIRENVDTIKKSANSLQNKHKTFVELGSKYFSCAAIGFNTLFVLPYLFRFLQIERPTFYTEI